jgi:hypothetical protein
LSRVNTAKKSKEIPKNNAPHPMIQPPPNDNTPNPPDPRKENFLYPRAPYHGEFKPENLLFNANLQEFAQKVSFICNLETAGKLSSLDAYEKIKALWKDLKQSKKGLGVGENPFKNDSEEDI